MDSTSDSFDAAEVGRGFGLDSGEWEDVSWKDAFLDLVPRYEDAEFTGDVFRGMVRQVEVSGDVACVVLVAGEVYCWGADSINLDGTWEERLRPRRISGLSRVSQLSVNLGREACAVDQDHHVWCWGANDRNSLETGSFESVLRVPRRRLDVDNISRVAWVGSNFLALGTDGNLYGRGGVNIPLPGLAVELSQGDGLSYCVLIAGGQVACYGTLTPGVPQRPDAATWSYQEGPRIVPELSEVASIASDISHYCALKRDGTVWCWGENFVGQTGTPPELSERCFVAQENDPLPRTVYDYCVRRPTLVQGLREVVEVVVGWFLSCARTRDGMVWCWGDDGRLGTSATVGYGRIGDGLPNVERCPRAPAEPPYETIGSAPCRRRPSRVVNISDAITISTNSASTCVGRASGEVWCWGSNVRGTLGDGTTTDRITPVPVRWPVARRDE